MPTRRKPEEVEAKKNLAQRVASAWRGCLFALPILAWYVFSWLLLERLGVGERFGGRAVAGGGWILTMIFYFGGWLLVGKIRKASRR